MDQRLSFVTLAVHDLDATRSFYLDGLRWRAEVDVPGEVLMIRVGEPVVRSLWVDTPARVRDWGGYTAYFADPDGFCWEVAWNPGPVGQLVLP